MSTQKTSESFTRPELTNTKPEQPLAFAPFPRRQMRLALYSPCCKIENLQTGIYLWDPEKKQP